MNILVEELLRENKNTFDLNKIEIKFNNTCDPELAKLFSEMKNNPYTRFGGSDTIQEICKKRENTKNKDVIPIQKIYYEGKLIGFSFPRKLEKVYLDHILENTGIDVGDKPYYKIGNYYITTKYRGLGIGKYVGIQFNKKYKNVIYTPKNTNVRSIGVAKAMGLKKRGEFHSRKSVYDIYMN